MIWGNDYSMQLLVNLVLLIIVFIRLYIKQKIHQNEDEITKNQTKK